MVLLEEHGGHGFLGGWRNTLTGRVYYNVCTQTERWKGEGRKEGGTQTTRTVDEGTEVGRNVGVQVHPLPDLGDRLLETGRFDVEEKTGEEVVEEEEERILRSVRMIQRFYRAHRQKSPPTHLPAISPQRSFRPSPQTFQEPPAYPTSDFVILNRTSPRTKADFELLYNLLDRWRISETEKARESLLGPSRVAFCSLILSKEVELLRALDSMKTSAKRRRKERNSRKFLDELSRPLLWRNSKGETILVDTPRVRRARDLRDLYLLLSKESSTNERLEILSKVRESIREHTCKHSYELMKLIDQEIDLMRTGVEMERLNWLRHRVNIGFLRLTRDSLKNEIQEEEIRRKKMCRSCGRLLETEKFSGETGDLSCCDHCAYLKARKGPRVVYEPYEKMLRDLRRCEGRKGCYSGLAFVVNSKVVYHLVNDIWHGRSAISEVDNFDELKLTRLEREKEWSPWNCLLLTKREALVHRTIVDLEKFYGPMLLRKFRTRNLQAKMYFGSMVEGKEN